MPNEGWEHFHHEADIGIRGFGKTTTEAFEQAARALTAVITDLDTVIPREKLQVSCSAPDLEFLLVDWLNTLVYEMATRSMIFCRFEVCIEGTELNAHVWGEHVEIERHQPAVEVKGATLTELSVCQDEEGKWLAQCVVDV